jgi:hypothetical protein
MPAGIALRRNHRLAEDINELFEVASALNTDEKMLLNVLSKSGPVLPAELAVKSFSLPEEVNETLRLLKDKELIVAEKAVSLGGGEVIYLSPRGRAMANIVLKMK